MQNKNLHTKKSGFSLPEIVMTFAIISILSGIALPMYLSLSVRNDLEVSTNTLVQTLRRAQTLSRVGDGDSSWGVKVENGSTTLFRGANYASRNSGFDESFVIPAAITATGTNEFVFSKFTGLLQSTNTVILKSNNNEERQITVNTKGVISY